MIWYVCNIHIDFNTLIYECQMQEIMLYLQEIESDLRNESVAILSDKSRTVVWPEVREISSILCL